jgi:hypothetical protein
VAALVVASLAIAGDEDAKDKKAAVVRYVPEMREIATADACCVVMRREAKDDGALVRVLTVSAEQAGKTGEEATECPLPKQRAELEDYRMAFFPKRDAGGSLTGYTLVTWRVAEDGADPQDAAMERREWPQGKRVAEASQQRILGDSVIVRAIWSDAVEAGETGTADPETGDSGTGDMPAKDKAGKSERVLWGFEIVAAKSAKMKPREPAGMDGGPDSGEPEGEGTPDGCGCGCGCGEETAEAKALHVDRVRMAVPRYPTPDAEYGIVLIPVWRTLGETIEGFDAVLIVTPTKESMAKTDRDAG